MKEVKVIAFYLPQFHTIPENNEWWGKDFTEWVNVKSAKPMFEGHNQPKIPLNENYYDLLDDEVKIWQAKIAKENGVYGFCYYHYWFNQKLLLEKPMEQMLKNDKVDINFCVCWANASWTKAWVGEDKKVLIPQTYGEEEEWRAHYLYLLPFFRDERYIKCNKKPLFVIYKPEDIPDCARMMEMWNNWSKEDGFDGIVFAFQTMGMDITNNPLRNKFDYDIEFQPSYGLYFYDQNRFKFLRKLKRNLVKKSGQFFAKNLHLSLDQVLDPQTKVRKIDYEEMCTLILGEKPISEHSIPGAFAKWDNTPRKGNRGIIYVNNTPEKFKSFMIKQIKRTIEVYKKDMLFIYAWNEWAEGGFLEPDKEFGYEYLESIRDALISNDALPEYNRTKLCSLDECKE